MDYEAGDLIIVKTKTMTKEGIVIPSPNNDIIQIKLDSGYNIAFEKSSIEKISVKEKKKAPQKKEPHTIKKSPKLKNISILHCGGTVAAKVDYKTGGVTANFSPDELVSLFPELKDLANIESRLIKQMMSENMRFAHYNIIAKEIEKELKEGVDGIVITHGTDTLHYTSAALAFMLENINIPVILVGSQKSSDRGSSDAAQNLISAVNFIAESDFCGVAICMHKGSSDDECMILPACKTRKMHTSRRDSFRPVNSKPIAYVDFKKNKITFNIDDYQKAGKIEKDLKILYFKEDIKVALIKTHSNMYAEEFAFYKGYKGLVIEGTGIGQLPNTVVDESTKESGEIIKTVREMAKETVMVFASQCIYGRVDMNVYAEGRTNLEAGMIGNDLDMTGETAFIKLAWLLSNYDKETAKELFMKNLRGEISERLEYSDNFLV
jgi:glutamyl-tRNA(Gln) amidotransferase subunit D